MLTTPLLVTPEDPLRQAIVTRYYGQTASRGRRVSATADAGRLYVEWDAELNREQNHQRAALALSVKLGWGRNLVGACLPGSAGYVWVQAPDSAPAVEAYLIRRKDDHNMRAVRLHVDESCVDYRTEVIPLYALDRGRLTC